MTDAPALDLSAYRLLVDERFDGDELARTRWLPHYLPHWSSRAATAARHEVSAGTLKLRIDADTPPWSPEFDGDVRVSHLQTGEFSGPIDSPVGQHRFRPGLVVREEQDEERLWLPRLGVVEARARAIRHPAAMVALWAIGFEEEPADSGEICIFEIFGREIDDDGGLVGVGVKPQHDPRLELDFEKVRVAGDLTEFHDYAVEWLPDRLRFFIDGRLVKPVPQSIAYPVQLMLDVYELPTDAPRDTSSHPLVFEVAHVREYVPR
ncbi:glycoside hydrolase family 16 protein [Agromyces bauzanensis]|uniref:GH16 domain-containing protein n=1 Tax=Agromyces bauzanensis TaxID=1308924 RepID=A0A917PPW7_9MICO|nr:glycoside hydrolase family 16 protein [Agromyces bauzanensis]GGJ86386.1 hypothetical protein GCM10011372_25990 [Agromyces bauzanensis]